MDPELESDMSTVPEHHPQVCVDFCGQRVQVDEEIAPLLHDLWRISLYTRESCQCGSQDRAYIYFTTREAGRDFFALIYDVVFSFDYVIGPVEHPDLTGSIVTFLYKELPAVTSRTAQIANTRRYAT
jgi:hypothetical protein